MLSVTYSIADTSPLLAYAPCQSCLPTVGWESAYAPLGDGYDQTFHQTSAGDATVSFNITASSMTFLTSPPSSVTCAATYSINGSSPSSACASSSSPSSSSSTNTTSFRVSNLPFGVHQVVYTPGYAADADAVDEFKYIGVTGEFELDLAGASNVTADSSTSSAFTYFPSTAAWTQISSNGINGSDANTTASSDFTDLSTFFQQTVSVSTVKGASASLAFSSAAVYLFGMSGPNGGMAEVLMDGSLMASVNLNNPWRAYSSLIYLQTGLDPSTTHNLTITNLDGSQLVLDYAILTHPDNSSTSSAHLAVVIATVAGVSAALLALGTCVFVVLVKKRRRARAAGVGGRGGKSGFGYGGNSATGSATGYPFENGIAYDDGSVKSASGGGGWGSASFSSKDSWRRLDGESVRSFGGARPGGGGGLDSPPPDYIPYRGPVELVPPSPPSPTTGGHDRTALSPVPTLSTSSTSSSPLPSSSSRRPSPLPLRPQPPGTPSTFSTALDGDSQFSPISLATPYLATTHVAVRAQAQNARRSVARLFNTASSTLLSSRAATVGTGTLGGASGADANRTTTMTRGSSTFAPSYTSAGELVPSAHLRILGLESGMTGTSGLGVDNDERRGPPAVAVPRSVQATSMASATPLRRGVSIKSVKTMRSFFSGLFVSSDPPPQLPLTAGGNTLASAARPDSDIFPSFSISRAPSRRVPTTTANSDDPGNGEGPGYGYGSSGGGGGVGRRYEYGYPSGISELPHSHGHTDRGTVGSTAPNRARGSSSTPRSGRARSSRPPHGLRLGRGDEDDESSPGHMFIELNPNSPVTVFSRPESEMTSYRPWGMEV